ncbi:MAG TPA: hypothetical protein VJ276_08165 [Thermoanaerobaculia bacterium]|nr:hypothetical protein [Thermoanaerobaculia bacterium]
MLLLLDVPVEPRLPEPTSPWIIGLITLSAIGAAAVVLTVRRRRQRPPA